MSDPPWPNVTEDGCDCPPGQCLAPFGPSSCVGKRAQPSIARSPPARPPTDPLEAKLHADILAVLRERQYHPPHTRDTAITDPYYDEVTAAIVAGIKAAGWELIPPARPGK